VSAVVAIALREMRQAARLRNTLRAMSQGNVDLVRTGYDALNRGDWDAALQHLAPGFELDFSRALGPGRGVYEGRDQLRRFLAELVDGWESVRFEPHEFIEAGDLVLVPMTQHVKGRDGIEVSASPTMVWTIRDGAVERAVMYQEREDALEAVGLSEQNARADSS
jgi:ketosteroid isomerase-like protein